MILVPVACSVRRKVHAEPSQCNDLLSFLVGQNVVHTNGGY
jgi:hypothetical protein